MSVHTLTDAEYAETAGVLVQLAGLAFDDSRRAALSAILHERLQATGSSTVAQYLDFVVTPSGAAERQTLLDAVTIQETHFFRNVPQIEALRRHLLPELVNHAAATRRPLTIWSAGCSTGEEPYTLAMLAQEAVGSRPVPVRILGTDVSASALAVASQAVYAGRTIQLAEAGAAERWFDPLDDGAFRVKREVRDLVEFRLHNLVTEPPPFAMNEIDLLVCRNVTIYFARETTRDLVHRFHGAMRDGSYLVLGHAETLWQVSDAFSLVPVSDAFAYRREARPVGRPARPVVRPPVRAAARPEPPRRFARARLLAPVRVIKARTPLAAPSTQEGELADARAALAAGRYPEAAERAAAVAMADPMSVEAYVIQGRALSNTGDDAAALEVLRKAVFLDPSAGHAHFLLASTLSRVGEPEAAALSFAAAAETLPMATPQALADLLDGRAVSDLVDLCRQLAAATRPTSTASPAPSGSATHAGRRRR
ncbi:MAG: protein-glutamate O-methyltransferase CheR [Actinomycetes bacterium]